jgi:hypothetical protein
MTIPVFHPRQSKPIQANPSQSKMLSFLIQTFQDNFLDYFDARTGKSLLLLDKESSKVVQEYATKRQAEDKSPFHYPAFRVLIDGTLRIRIGNTWHTFESGFQMCNAIKTPKSLARLRKYKYIFYVYDYEDNGWPTYIDTFEDLQRLMNSYHEWKKLKNN